MTICGPAKEAFTKESMAILERLIPHLTSCGSWMEIEFHLRLRYTDGLFTRGLTDAGNCEGCVCESIFQKSGVSLIESLLL